MVGKANTHWSSQNSAEDFIKKKYKGVKVEKFTKGYMEMSIFQLTFYFQKGAECLVNVVKFTKSLLKS